MALVQGPVGYHKHSIIMYLLTAHSRRPASSGHYSRQLLNIISAKTLKNIRTDDCRESSYSRYLLLASYCTVIGGSIPESALVRSAVAVS